jgi:hypothetical protein
MAGVSELESKLNRVKLLDASQDASTDDVRPRKLWWWADDDDAEDDAEGLGDSESTLGPYPEVRRRFPHASSDSRLHPQCLVKVDLGTLYVARLAAPSWDHARTDRRRQPKHPCRFRGHDS